MTYILFTKKKDLIATSRDPIRQGENLSAKIVVLMPTHIHDIDTADTVVKLVYTRQDGFVSSVLLTRSGEMYNEMYYQFTLPVDSAMTKKSGILTVRIEVFSSDSHDRIIAKSGNCNLKIRKVDNSCQAEVAVDGTLQLNVVNLCCLKQPIPLGIRGENDVTLVALDFSAWAEMYGTGTMQLFVRRDGDAAPYPVKLTTTGTTANWLVSATDLANVGIVMAEWRYTVGTAIKKSCVLTFYVAHDIGNPGSAPAPCEDWFANLKAWLDELEERIAELEHGEHPPQPTQTYGILDVTLLRDFILM